MLDLKCINQALSAGIYRSKGLFTPRIKNIPITIITTALTPTDENVMLNVKSDVF